MTMGDISLASPYWLALIPAFLLAAWAACRRLEPRRAAWSFPDGAALAAEAPRWPSRFARWTPYALKGLALALGAAALARPQAASRQAAGLTEGIDILLVIDTSTSMKALDFAPMDRMSAAKDAAKRFVSGRIADRIGLVTFGGAPILACPLTLDYEALVAAIDELWPGMTGVEGTAIGDGLAAGVNHLKGGRSPSKVVILLTDGRANAGVVDPMTAAKAAAASGVKVYTIGTAKRGPSQVPVPGGFALIHDDLDDVLLTQVAETAGGRYFRAESAKELREVYAEIDRMERVAVKRPETVSYKDLYPWLLLPALALLSAEAVLARTWLLRLP